MADPAEDPGFERDLASLAERYRATASDEPPAALDAAIRANARAAVAPARQRSWWVPASVAATALLAVAVVIQIERSPPPHGVAPERVANQVAAPAAPAPTAATAPVAVAPATAPAIAVTAEPAPAPPAAEADRSGMAADEAPASAKVPPAEVAATPMAERTAAAQAAPLLEQARGELQSAENAGKAAAMAAPAPAAATRSPAADAAALPEPATWLKRIEALRKAGRAAEADAELAKLRAAYPGWLESRQQRRD